MNNNAFLKGMGKKIKDARVAKKLSLPKLSLLTGIDMSNLWFIEVGRRNPHILTLKIISEVLEVDIKDFI